MKYLELYFSKLIETFIGGVLLYLVVGTVFYLTIYVWKKKEYIPDLDLNKTR
jgi:CHASE3 domain sensor protein